MGSLLRPTFSTKLPAGTETFIRDGKRFARVRIGGKVQAFPVTKSGKGYRRKTEIWYGQYLDGTGTVQRVPLSNDKAAAKQMLAKLELRAERQRNGLLDPAEDHAQRTLAKHLADYVAILESKGDTDGHVDLTRARIEAIIDGCGFVFPRDVQSTAVAKWLTDRLDDEVAVEVPGLDSFSPSEAARLLNISGAAVRSAVKRMRLSASGNGRARRYPRATVEAIANKMARGNSPQTVNHYTRAIRGFFRWLRKDRRIGENPLDSLELLNAEKDVRRMRRELTRDELQRLFVATRESKRTYRRIDGAGRYHLYLVAASTGFRSRALGNLTPACFHLDRNPPTVALPARYNKAGKVKVQPLPVEVAEAMREYLGTIDPAKPVWGGTWSKDKKGAEMLRGDLEAAGIPYAVETPDGPLYADFHALRHSFLTLGGRSGIDLRTLQVLAGHSKPEITARYTHRGLDDLAGEIGKLPNLVPDGNPLALILALTPRLRLHQPAPICTTADSEAVERESQERLETKQPGAVLHRVASICTSEGDGTRTRNLRIDSPVTLGVDGLDHKAKSPTVEVACTDSCTNTPELAELTSRWNALPATVKAAILAIVNIEQPKARKAA